MSKKIPKNLDLSHETDLDIWEYFGSEKIDRSIDIWEYFGSEKIDRSRYLGIFWRWEN